VGVPEDARAVVDGHGGSGEPTPIDAFGEDRRAEEDAAGAALAILAAPVIGMLASAAQMGERPAGLEATGLGLLLAALVLVGPLAIRQARRGGASSAATLPRAGSGIDAGGTLRREPRARELP